MEQIGEETQEGQMATQDTDGPIGKDLGIIMEQTENDLELGEYLNGMIVQDIILEHSLSSSERDALHQYRNMIDELITPRLKDLDYEHSKSICDALDDGNSIGLSGTKIWKRIATELIQDSEVLETFQPMDKPPFQRWVDCVCDEYWGITTEKFMEVSKKLNLPNVVSYLEECWIARLSDLNDDLRRILERDGCFHFTNRDYEIELNIQCKVEGTVMEILLYYLRKWKPRIKLSSLKQICIDEQLDDGILAIHEADCYINSN